jgi:hypothetical protein
MFVLQLLFVFFIFFHKTNFVWFFTIFLFYWKRSFLVFPYQWWTPTLCEGCQQTLNESRNTKEPKVSSKTNPQSTAHASGLAADLLTGDSVA